MDNYGWDIPSTITSEMNLPPCFWSNRQKETSKSSAQSIVDYGIVRGDVDLTEAFLISSKGLHGVVVKTSEPTKLDGVSEMAGLLLPPSHLESMSSSSAAEMSHSQEALWLAAAAELTTSDTATPWRGGLSSLGHLKEHFGLANNECSQVHIDIGDEEDVSAILSNCDNIPNLMSCSGNVSSGESENCSSHRGDKEPHHHCSNVDEVVSQGSPNPDPTGFTPSQSRPNLKRKERGIDDYNEAEGSLYRDVLQSDSCATEGGFRIFFENNQSKWKRPRSDRCQQRASSIDFRMENGYEPDAEAIAQVKEMIYRAAAMRPVSLAAVEALEKPKRKNVKISSDPQTVAARHRRERISERLRVLQRLVPGGSKMDTASMLDEAANYLKFLKSQVSALETLGSEGGIGSMAAASSSPSLPLSSVPFHQSFPMQTLHPQVQTLAQGHPQKGTPAGAPHHLQF